MQEVRSMKNDEFITNDDDSNRFDKEGDLEKWNQHESEDAEWMDGDIYLQAAPTDTRVREIK